MDARSLLLLFLLSAVFVAGCIDPSESSSVPSQEAVDEDYLTASLWDDGQGEVAFYEVQRTQNQYGEAEDQQFLVGTYLVKHPFSPEDMSKATEEEEGAVSSFKYALFYEFESGSYQYKRSYVTNARQEDLSPLKASFTSFDWCSNLYEELAFRPDGSVEVLMRSDDYGNRHERFESRANAYPPALVPLLVRGLDFSEEEEHTFQIVLPEERYVSAQARYAGTDTLDLPDGELPAERITVTYDEAVPSVIAEEADQEETYWRSTDSERALLRLEGASGRYRMELVEKLRSPYWEEDLWPELARVSERP